MHSHVTLALGFTTHLRLLCLQHNKVVCVCTCMYACMYAYVHLCTGMLVIGQQNVLLYHSQLHYFICVWCIHVECEVLAHRGHWMSSPSTLHFPSITYVYVCGCMFMLVSVSVGVPYACMWRQRGTSCTLFFALCIIPLRQVLSWTWSSSFGGKVDSQKAPVLLVSPSLCCHLSSLELQEYTAMSSFSHRL